MTKAIGTLGNLDFVVAGGRQFTDPQNSGLIVLYASIGAGGGTQYTTFRANGGSAGYQVTSGKTYQIRGARLYIEAVVAGNFVGIGYGNTDVGLNGGSAPTTPKYPASDGPDASSILFSTATITTAWQDIPVWFDVPATKYPFMQGPLNAKATVMIFGYEV